MVSTLGANSQVEIIDKLNLADLVESNITNITYTSDVDQDYGFYRVIDITTKKPAPYTNNRLTINVGDTVVWINDATPDEPLTIISKEGLWGNRTAYLRWNYQKFSYLFNQSGTYEVYIREYPRVQHQIITVNPIEPIITVTSVPTIQITTSKETIVPTETETTSEEGRKTRDLAIIWVLIIFAGLITFVIYEIKKKKEKEKRI